LGCIAGRDVDRSIVVAVGGEELGRRPGLDVEQERRSHHAEAWIEEEQARVEP
jgi:hypothetical protein